MKFTFLSLALIFVSSFALNAKSRLGEYYLGFGYTLVDGGKSGNLEGGLFDISANSMASDSTDFILNFSYGNVETNGTDGKRTSFEAACSFHTARRQDLDREA